MEKKLEIVIVNHNSTISLINCLDSICSNQDACEIGVWVWDNNSEDDPGLIKHRFPWVYMDESDRNIGFAAAVNKGLGWSSAPYVMILNPDTLIKENIIDTILSLMDQQQDIGVLGPKILNDDGSLQQSARAFPNWMTGLFGRTSILTKMLPENRISKKNLLCADGNGKTPVEVDWVSGACMLVRRKAVQQVGLLDERFFMYWEDADWCRKMREKGWKVVYYPGASVYHSVGQSSRKKPFRLSLEFHKSAYRLYSKYAKGYQNLLKPLVFGFLSIRFYARTMKLLIQKIYKLDR